MAAMFVGFMLFAPDMAGMSMADETPEQVLTVARN